MPNLLMIDLLGTEVSEEEKALLQHPNVGALLLFSRNFANPEQLTSLIGTVSRIRPDIFIAIDHEGGNVQRFQRQGFRSLPAARIYGDMYDKDPAIALEMAAHYGKVMAEDLLKYGIDLSLAPVLDLHGISHVIGGLDRAFHSKPEIVAQLAMAFIQGMNTAGMPATGKHFPGHGSVSSDSHVSKPVTEMSMTELQERDLKPFVDLIQRDVLAAVMPAHVTYTAIDATHPAGFSKTWLQDILRDTYHFNGLILSDCLSMKGADIGDMKDRTNRALEAGCDMLIVCNQPRELLHELLHTITFVQSKASADRIEAFKRKMLRFSAETTEKITPYLSHTIHAVPPTAAADSAVEHDTVAYNTTTSI